ncbi:MAG TPA: peptidylprolyl isomerase [Terracidiphilus sp.]|nr:peptidylprolyl isomerase [Terracidiphilus sp.]
MTLNFLRIPAALVLGTALFAIPGRAQLSNAAPASPYGGSPVEEIIARVNDRVINTSDYNRALKELDQEERQRGASMQEMADARKDLLRNLIDQQLWLSKGKDLGITGETELVNRLNEIRKQYHMASLEDLEKAAQEQGVSYEDFKANIRNGIITQEVMRNEVGRRISITPGEVERYFEQHKQEYARQESVHLAEILISTGAPVPSATVPGEYEPVDPAKLAEAKAKAEAVEAKLRAGADFSQLAKTFSSGTTASSGGDLGQFRRGALAKALEEKVFPLKAGQYTEPIQTRQGMIILKVISHTPGGVPPYKDVQQDVEQNYFMSKMEPALRAYLTKMREEAYIDIRQGYVDTGASPNETKLVYSAYVPPAPKKKRKVERTRFRDTGRGFRNKSREQEETARQEPEKTKEEHATMKMGKKEKIRFGQAPQETLPDATTPTPTENAGAVTRNPLNSEQAQMTGMEQPAPEAKKTRFSDRLRDRDKQKEEKKAQAQKKDVLAPEPETAAEVADRQVQSAPLGLSGDTASKKKKAETTTGEKTRLSDRLKEEEEKKKEEAGQKAPSANETPTAPAPAPQQ